MVTIHQIKKGSKPRKTTGHLSTHNILLSFSPPKVVRHIAIMKNSSRAKARAQKNYRVTDVSTGLKKPGRHMMHDSNAFVASNKNKTRQVKYITTKKVSWIKPADFDEQPTQLTTALETLEEQLEETREAEETAPLTTTTKLFIDGAIEGASKILDDASEMAYNACAPPTASTNGGAEEREGVEVSTAASTTTTSGNEVVVEECGDPLSNDAGSNAVNEDTTEAPSNVNAETPKTDDVTRGLKKARRPMINKHSAPVVSNKKKPIGSSTVKNILTTALETLEEQFEETREAEETAPLTATTKLEAVLVEEKAIVDATNDTEAALESRGNAPLTMEFVEERLAKQQKEHEKAMAALEKKLTSGNEVVVEECDGPLSKDAGSNAVNEDTTEAPSNVNAETPKTDDEMPTQLNKLSESVSLVSNQTVNGLTTAYVRAGEDLSLVGIALSQSNVAESLSAPIKGEVYYDQENEGEGMEISLDNRVGNSRTVAEI